MPLSRITNPFLGTSGYRSVTDFTATAGQTSFTVPSYAVGYIDVYRNGVKLAAADFTATTGTTVVLASGANLGDVVTAISSYIGTATNLSVTGGTINGQLVVNSATGINPFITQVNSTEVLRIDTSGNVGIGTSSPSTWGKFAVVGASPGGQVVAAITNTSGTASTQAVLSFDTTNNGFNVRDSQIRSTNNGSNQTTLEFYTANGTTPAERMRIDSSGNLLVGATSAPSISGVASNSCIVSSSATGNWQLGIQNTSSSGGPRGIAINYSAQTPNGTASEALFFSDSTAYRFSVRSNGGIANYSANNVNISDRREKINFAPAKSYLDVICAIPVQTFNYIDQNLEEDDGLTLGVVAQDVQAVAPELVMESDWSSKRDGSKMRLSIYQTDLQYALMKAIQEQQALILALTARIEALETK